MQCGIYTLQCLSSSFNPLRSMVYLKVMKIIHTSDWHLGQRFFDKDRLEEQILFLDYLIDFIQKEKITALIIAGDIFDTANPTREAEKVYYDFLHTCSSLHTCQVIIVGGNHDSATHLDAPRALLKAFNITVVGSLPSEPEDVLIALGEDPAHPKAWLCAIPFLRDRDVRKAVEGERFNDMQERTRQGIINCYRNIAEEITTTIKPHTDIPVICTGHLCLLDAQVSDSERSVHIGNLGSISAKHFPDCFDYYALGHLHRAQSVGENENIRYSGSPLPLSFGEQKSKEMRLLEIDGTTLTHRKIELPVFRRLIRLRGDQKELQAKLTTLAITREELMPWVEITLTKASIGATEQEELRDIAQKHGAALLKIGLDVAKKKTTVSNVDHRSLAEITPRDVFDYRLGEYESDVDTQTLQACFTQILEEVEGMS